VNNYKQEEQIERTKQNIERSIQQETQRIDFHAPDLQKRVTESDPDLVILTGSSALLSKPATRKLFEAEMDLVRNASFPIIGICYGHQIIGSAFDAPMRDLGQMFRSYEQVRVVRDHPLFDGLPSEIMVAESHRQEVTRVPSGFHHLAQSSTSRVEAMAHKSKPIYGVQFHPERSSDEHPHGRMILQNVLKLVRKQRLTV